MPKSPEGAISHQTQETKTPTLGDLRDRYKEEEYENVAEGDLSLHNIMSAQKIVDRSDFQEYIASIFNSLSMHSERESHNFDAEFLKKERTKDIGLLTEIVRLLVVKGRIEEAHGIYDSYRHQFNLDL